MGLRSSTQMKRTLGFSAADTLPPTKRATIMRRTSMVGRLRSSGAVRKLSRLLRMLLCGWGRGEVRPRAGRLGCLDDGGEFASKPGSHAGGQNRLDRVSDRTFPAALGAKHLPARASGKQR